MHPYRRQPISEYGRVKEEDYYVLQNGPKWGKPEWPRYLFCSELKQSLSSDFGDLHFRSNSSHVVVDLEQVLNLYFV